MATSAGAPDSSFPASLAAIKLGHPSQFRVPKSSRHSSHWPSHGGRTVTATNTHLCESVCESLRVAHRKCLGRCALVGSDADSGLHIRFSLSSNLGGKASPDGGHGLGVAAWADVVGTCHSSSKGGNVAVHCGFGFRECLGAAPCLSCTPPAWALAIPPMNTLLRTSCWLDCNRVKHGMSDALQGHGGQMAGRSTCHDW